MTHSKQLHPVKQSYGVIANIQNLCAALNISEAELNAARAIPQADRYEQGEVEKKDGSPRVVYNPHYLLRRIQRRINRRLFADSSMVRWPDHIFGSIPNDDYFGSNVPHRDYANCAAQHCQAKSILSVDIQNFFSNIHVDLVRDVFENFFKFPPDVSDALVDICCLENGIVQGALTSSYIATLCLFRYEGALVAKLGYKNLVYTRLVDDITISSKVSHYDFDYALSQIESMLASAGLPLNKRKTQIQYASMKPLIVHGLRVDYQQPRLPPEEPRRIRAAVKNLEMLAQSPGYRASRTYRKDFNRCMGRVNKLARVGHSQHVPLATRLKRILPLASHKDIERAEKLIARLQLDVAKPNYTSSFWFYKRINVASERLGILKRSFPAKAAELRKTLSVLKSQSAYE